LDSNRIIELIKFPASASSQEQDELLQLCQQYPYGTILKIVYAKVAAVNNSPEVNKYITSAAIASVDRVNLQHFIKASEWVVSTLPDTQPDTRELEEQTSSKKETEADAEKDKMETVPNPFKDEKETGAEKIIATDVLDIEVKKEVPEPEEEKRSLIREESEMKSPPLEKPIEQAKISAPSPERKSEPEKIKEKVEKITEAKKDIPAEPEKKEIEVPKSSEKDKKDIRDLTEKKQTTPPVENKKTESPETTGEQKTEQSPLASDILRNIQEYRKNRDFFEKMLEENHDSEVKSSQITDKDKSTPLAFQKEDAEAHKHKKSKKKKAASGKDDKPKKSDQKEEEIQEDLRLKKNFENPDQKPGKEIVEDAEPASSLNQEESDKKKEEAERSLKSDTSSEETTSVENTSGDQPGQGQNILSEIPDQNTIEKVTEEQKSEGYPVYEEEDPSVIKKFLEKITDEPEGSNPPKKLKKEEQVEIIEKFIRSEPKIKNIKTAQTLREREDLSLPSVKFKDDIISENLANIMKSQGKTEQAIDIYKKLIWKFPQKKAYFASQIEELKKKLGK
jgi:tetratricopeptide (TPR) repeat protein